ncbi:hypothetical protein [Planktothrix sp. FACHB-1365]|nr:hypothetical protein [Planktothrix sp. FACHB-1365]
MQFRVGFVLGAIEPLAKQSDVMRILTKPFNLTPADQHSDFD